jgi:hypothetical protein
LATPPTAAQVAVIDCMRTVPEATISQIVDGTNLSRRAVRAALSGLIRGDGKVVGPFKPPRYMTWARQDNGQLTLQARLRVKSGKDLHEFLYTADRELAKKHIVSPIKRLIAAGKIDRDHKAAKLYLRRTITEAELGPLYRTWVHQPNGGTYLMTAIPLKNGKLLQRRIDPADPDAAMVRYTKALIVVGLVDPDDDVAKLYVDSPITQAERDEAPRILNDNFFAKPSVEAPPCMVWRDGDIINSSLRGRRVKGRVLYGNVYLRGGCMIDCCFNTADPKVAWWDGLRPLVLEALTEGKLGPNSRAARVDAEISRLAALPIAQYDHERDDAAKYLRLSAAILDQLVEGGRERTLLAPTATESNLPPDSGRAAPPIAKTRNAKGLGGRPRKSRDVNGGLTADAEVFFDVVSAALEVGPKTIKTAINEADDRIPLSQKTKKSGKKLAIGTMVNNFLKLRDAKVFFDLVIGALEAGTETITSAIEEVYERIPVSQRRSSCRKKNLDIPTLEKNFLSLRAVFAPTLGAAARSRKPLSEFS